ncbi:hypothetical protein niasHS_007144 [Heterodera schachtii]|uniref:Uncharacterized protein n=1 Tax=Heterodera schachtii TaxID=97005 RepID=A0ABD2JL64_HETSC
MAFARTSVLSPLLLFIFLLFNCCLCQPNVFSPNDFACAKKNAIFHDGLFTLTEDNRLRIDPSKQKTNDNGTQLDALLLNPIKERLVFSLIFIKGGENCKQFFMEHAERPSCCLFSDEMELHKHPYAKGECQAQKCTYVDMTCSVLPMDPVEGLKDSYHFKVSSWNTVSGTDEMQQCDWIAFADGIRILQKKAGNDTKTLEEKCWKKVADGSSAIRVALLVIGFLIILLVVVAMVVLLLYLRRRKWKLMEVFCCKKKKSKPMVEEESESASMEEEEEESEPEPSYPPMPAPPQKIPPPQKVEQPTDFSNSSAAQTGQSVAIQHGIEVPDSFRSVNEDED